MSDDDEEYEYDEDMDDDDNNNKNSNNENNGEDDDEVDDDEQFEYTDEEEEPDDDKVALENSYYNAKSVRDSGNLTDAIQAFESTIADANAASATAASASDTSQIVIWAFKSLKQLCKLALKFDKDRGEFLRHYQRLLACIRLVSPNAVEKGISNMMERVSALYQQGMTTTKTSPRRVNATETESSQGYKDSREDTDDNDHNHNNNTDDDPQQHGGWVMQVYDCTLPVFHPAHGTFPNERLWFKTTLKLGQLLYEKGDTPALQALLRDLHLHYHHPSSSSSSSSSSSASSTQQSLEIYALQIQLYHRLKDHKKLRETYTTAMTVVAGSLPHPRTLALIQELGGKMYMAGKEYGAAEKSFFQAFKSYDEAGDMSRLRCLKYLVLASMLHASTINPFDSQEARPYRDDAEITAMTNLVSAFHNGDVATFEYIVKTKQSILRDELIREHVSDLLRTIRRQVLKRALEPYRRISLEAIRTQFLNDIPIQEVESLLVGMILDEVLPNARIDKNQGVLYNLPRHFFPGASSRTQSGESGSSIRGDTRGDRSESSISTGREDVVGNTGRINSRSPTLEKLQAMESLMDLLNKINCDTITAHLSSTAAGADAGISHRGGGYGGAGRVDLRSGPGLSSPMRGINLMEFE